MWPPLLLAGTQCQLARPWMLLLTPLLLTLAASPGHSLRQHMLPAWSLWRPPHSTRLVGQLLGSGLLDAQTLLPRLAGPR